MRIHDIRGMFYYFQFVFDFKLYTAAGKEASTDSQLQPPLHRQWYSLRATAACNNDENNVKNNDV